MPRRAPSRRTVVAHARVTPAELSAWNAMASAAGVTLSELLRQAMSRTQTWTAPAMAVERERTRQVARIGSNLNQIARWANTHLDELAPVEVIAHLVAIERADVAVLRGDPDQVAAAADALEFEQKYTSAVIAWAPEDQPSDTEIDRVLDEFEDTAWPGLAPDRYAWTAVRHREAGRGVHVHVVAARCDLETGKSLNIAAWANRTWAFDSANVLPPLRPRARAPVSPARVRSRISPRQAGNAARSH